MIFSNYVILESVAEIPLKKSHEIRCTNMYEKFMKMGKENFIKRYPAYPIMDTCLKLFHDPNWDFKGKTLIDEKYSSDLVYQSNSQMLTKLKIGSDKFLVKFNVCSENDKKTKYLLITTDKEEFIGQISRSFNGSCADLWMQIYANSPEDTKFSWIYDPPANSKIRKLL